MGRVGGWEMERREGGGRNFAVLLAVVFHTFSHFVGLSEHKQLIANILRVA